jgi:DNA adenine methylase
MKTPLRYPGGKTRAVKTLVNYIPEDCKKLCSPFLGGGSFELAQAEKGIKVYAYDAFYPLYNFWNHLLTNKDELVGCVRDVHPLTKKRFKEFRKQLKDYESGSDVKMAAAYFAINRSSFSGATLSGGFSQQAADGRFNENSIKRLENFIEPNLNVGFLSFEESIVEHSDCFLYLDPPYYLEDKSRLYGKNGDMHLGFDHQLLCDLLKSRDSWLLSYNDCEVIRELYKDYEIIEASWAYGMNKSKKSSEVLIMG